MTGLDWAALALFLLCWLFYEPLLGVVSRRSGSLNSDMKVVREVWMRAMTGREIRLVDSQLLGHTINSASFFASANLLLMLVLIALKPRHWRPQPVEIRLFVMLHPPAP